MMDKNEIQYIEDNYQVHGYIRPKNIEFLPHSKYNLNINMSGEEYPVIENTQRIGKRRYWYVKERHMIATYTITLLFYEERGLFKRHEGTGHQILEELGKLFALQNVGWDWIKDGQYPPLNTMEEGPNINGRSFEHMFGYTSDNPMKDRKRVYELINEIERRIKIIKSAF